MQQSFEYFHLVTAMDSITVDDIGNCNIIANNDMELFWYLQIKTDEGWTVVKEFGPIHPRLEDKSKYGFNYNKYTSEYNEKKIGVSIDKFINNPKRGITQVREAEDWEIDEVLEKVREKFI